MVNAIADEISAEFTKRPDLREMASLRIRRRGEEDGNRRIKFQSYRGPDGDTLKVVEEHAAEWAASPLKFWNHILSTDQQFTIPQAYPVLCHLRASACDDV